MQESLKIPEFRFGTLLPNAFKEGGVTGKNMSEVLPAGPAFFFFLQFLIFSILVFFHLIIKFGQLLPPISKRPPRVG